MTPAARERMRLLLIGSSVVASALVLLLGVPKLRAWMTPRILGVVVASRSFDDPEVSVMPRETLAGVPVRLYALVRARPRFAAEARWYGTVTQARLSASAAPVAVHAWSGWWLQPEFLWSKVEPAFPFANEGLDPEFDPTTIRYQDSYQVSWGFDWSHAADIAPTGDAFPRWQTGTMRFAVQVVVRDQRGRILQRAGSPAADAVWQPEGAGAPHRVTVRGGDDAAGWLVAFAGLPYVPVAPRPGRAHPAERWLAGTVLDFWLLANRRAGVPVGRPVWWTQLDRVADRVLAEIFMARDGIYYHGDDPLRPVRWGEVRAGDLLVIEDHVGVLLEDRGPGGGGDGLLDRHDRVIEAYFEPLRNSPLGDAFVADVEVWRLRVAAGSR